MTDADEQVARLLTELAHRADGHGPHDRVPLVRRRARRTAAVRASALAGALVTVLALVVALRGDHLPLLRGVRPEPAQPAPPRVASLVVDLRQDDALTDTLPRSQPGTRAVVVVHVHGLVPARAVKDVSPSGREHLLGLRVITRDRTQSSTGDDDAPCVAGGPLVPVDDEFPVEVFFVKAGANELTYETTACSPVGTVRQTITVQAR
jgi:hypothetical protein